MVFISAAGADRTSALIRAPTATITSKAFAMSSSLLSPIRRPHRRPGFVARVMAACVTLRAAEILLAEPGEDHRRDDQHKPERADHAAQHRDRKSTRLNSSHLVISYAVFCLKKKKTIEQSDASAPP